MSETKNLLFLLVIIALPTVVGGALFLSLISNLARSDSFLIGNKIEEAVANTDFAAFKLSPQKGVFERGKPAEIKIKVNTGGVAVSVIQTSLSYTYTHREELKVIDDDKNPANGIQIKPGNIKELDYITNRVLIEPEEGLVTIELVGVLKNPRHPLKTNSDEIFGTIVLMGKEPITGGIISFDQEKSKMISAVFNKNILAKMENGTYTIR